MRLEFEFEECAARLTHSFHETEIRARAAMVP